MTETAGADWTDDELRLIVADYFEMLRTELLNQNFSKTDHRNRLLERLTARSKGSIEFKHQNISAVLLECGLPFIRGYKPARNYQAKLADFVEEGVDQNADFFQEPAVLANLEPTTPAPSPTTTVDKIVAVPAELIEFRDAPERKSRRGRKIDFAERDARNRQMGRAGEQWTFELERRRLFEVQRDDLAAKVEWVADTQGDGLGFDILSFDHQTDGERKIEVKTTALTRLHPFLVTPNELSLSQEEPDRFRLYRVFDFGADPKTFILAGSLDAAAQLVPAVYRAVPPFKSAE